MLTYTFYMHTALFLSKGTLCSIIMTMCTVPFPSIPKIRILHVEHKEVNELYG